MRGKVVHVCACNSQCRITPAYAGKSFIMDCRLQAGQDHPRLCGEKLRLLYHRGEFLGSPPPMRGKVGYRSRSFLTFRITPAYAGKSTCRGYTKTGSGDHPRLCGEKLPVVELRHFASGSPPPMRGKGGSYSNCEFVGRITPAYAGKRVASTFSLLIVRGSPPPMRGKVRVVVIKSRFRRITPAYAGKSNEADVVAKSI